MNPLFPDNDGESQDKKDQGYVLKRSGGRTVSPPVNSGGPSGSGDTNVAADLIRRKLDALYAKEPNAGQELAESKQQAAAARSKHQQFMYELSTSSKPLAQIQTEWHNYYVALPDAEKHEVWQEFYAANARRPSAYVQFVEQQKSTHAPAAGSPPPEMPALSPNRSSTTAFVADHSEDAQAKKPVKHKLPADRRSVADLKKQVLKKVRLNERAQRKAKQHIQSLAFGLGIGALTLLVVLFSFFNEVVIAPFIQPSRHATNTPIILNTDSVAPNAKPEVIIPKINVEIPVDFNQTSIDEAAAEKTLENGVLHYPTTVRPGEMGNAAFFGHSSNNLFNKGKYKFAFVLLHELVPGDVFYLTSGSKIYAYRVYDKKIVEPSEVSVLNNVADKPATATLITCDPPGTSLHRLVVWGEQISPDPSGNGAASTSPAAPPPTQLTDNGPTLWSRLINWIKNLF
jgi:sortase A